MPLNMGQAANIRGLRYSEFDIQPLRSPWPLEDYFANPTTSSAASRSTASGE
jgi:hypothetical protein